MNRTTFFASLGDSPLFNCTLTQTQVDGIQAILNQWELYNNPDLRQLGYILGTVYHEAGKGMCPVREGFATTNRQAVQNVTTLYNRGEISRNYALPDASTGQSYYGRGFIQLTWKGNYATFERLLHLPLTANPDLALKTDVAAAIAVRGMLGGLFTGKSLSCFFNATTCDWLNARRIINGTDRAQLVAGYANFFYEALMKVSNTPTAN